YHAPVDIQIEAPTPATAVEQDRDPDHDHRERRQHEWRSQDGADPDLIAGLVSRDDRDDRQQGLGQGGPDRGEDRADGSLRQAEPLADPRSEEHTSELQSLAYLVCRLLLEK